MACIYEDTAENIVIQFFDGRSATQATANGDKYPWLKTAEYFDTLPTIGDPQKTREPEPISFRRRIKCYRTGEEVITPQEFTLSIPLLEEDTAASKNVWQQFFMYNKTDDTYGTPTANDVISTNDGNATARNKSSWTTETTGMPLTEKMIGVHVFFKGSVAAKQHGLKMNYVQIKTVVFEPTDGVEHMTVTFVNHGVATETTELLTQTTVTI